MVANRRRRGRRSQHTAQQIDEIGGVGSVRRIALFRTCVLVGQISVTDSDGLQGDHVFEGEVEFAIVQYPVVELF